MANGEEGKKAEQKLNAAERLRSGMDEIIAEWERRVRKTFSAARTLDRIILIDSLPNALDNLADLLDFPAVTALAKMRERQVSAKHGLQRSTKTDYAPEEIIIEYHVLEEVLFDLLDTDEAPMTREERRVVRSSMQLFVSTSVKAYVEDTRSLSLYREAELSHLIAAVKDVAIMMMDPNGYFLSWNPGAQKLKQWTEEEAIERHMTILYRAEDLWKPAAELRIAREKGKIEDEGWRARKDGSLFWADVIITPIWDNGKLKGFSKVARDITERAKLEEDLRQNVNALKDEKHAREKFVMALSHDLRNPLTAAKVAAELMVRYPEKSDSREERYKLSSKIVNSLSRADAMVQDLLDTNRIQAGADFPIEVESCDLVQVIRDCLDEIDHLGQGRLILRAPEQIPGFWSTAHLRRSVENLVSNAIKYGDPERAVEVTLAQDSDRVLIQVHNWGTPIPPEDLKHIFRPFHRANTEVSKSQPGWGIGLALVKGIIEAHEGRVYAKSSARDGTTFTIELPNTAQVGKLGLSTRTETGPALPGNIDLNRA